MAVSGLTTPLDQWVSAATRTARLDMLLRVYGSGARNDHSYLNVDDALPLLTHACKTGFGDLTALDFGIMSSQGPLAYSAVLTITGPDEIGIEFPNSGKHATQLQAKMHAAYKAILGGAIGYIMQSAGPITADLNEPAVQVPTSPKLASECIPQSAPSDSTKTVAPSAKPGKKSRATKSKAAPDALNLINTYLQRVYRDHKTTMPKSSQEWEVVFFGGGVTARLTIRLPSGGSRSYGDLPGKPSVPGKPPKIYPSTTAAKREVAAEAVRANVLEFIQQNEPGEPTPPRPPSPAATKVRARDPLSSYVAYDPSKAARATSANSVPVSGIAGPPRNGLHRPSFSGPVPEERAPNQNVGPVPPLEQVLDTAEVILNRGTTPQPHRSPSPVDEMEAVDDLLGPASLSNAESSEREDDDEVDELASSEYDNDRLPSEGRSEPMELDSETGTPPREIAVSQPGDRVSPPRDEPEPIDEPPTKRQRTEPPEDPISETDLGLKLQEPKIMFGTSFSNILSEFCFERGHAQPQVTYLRNFEHPKEEGPVMYSVSIILGGSRFELSKPYESIEMAEEKLSKRILRQFGVRARKI